MGDGGVEGESDALICEPGWNPLNLPHQSTGVHQTEELDEGQQTSLDVWGAPAASSHRRMANVALLTVPKMQGGATGGRP